MLLYGYVYSADGEKLLYFYDASREDADKQFTEFCEENNLKKVDPEKAFVRREKF